MKAITTLYGWTADHEEGRMVDLHAPFPTWEDLAQDVVAHYDIGVDEEVDVVAGTVRPMRVWEFTRPSLDDVLAVMRRGCVPQTVPVGSWADAAGTVTLRPGESGVTAEYRMRVLLTKWANAHLTTTGWWLVAPQTITVDGSGEINKRVEDTHG